MCHTFLGIVFLLSIAKTRGIANSLRSAFSRVTDKSVYPLTTIQKSLGTATVSWVPPVSQKVWAERTQSSSCRGFLSTIPPPRLFVVGVLFHQLTCQAIKEERKFVTVSDSFLLKVLRF